MLLDVWIETHLNTHTLSVSHIYKGISSHTLYSSVSLSLPLSMYLSLSHTHTYNQSHLRTFTHKNTGTLSHCYIRRTLLTQRNVMKQTQILTHTINHSYKRHYKINIINITMLTFELLNTDIHTCTPAQTCTESHTQKQISLICETFPHKRNHRNKSHSPHAKIHIK